MSFNIYQENHSPSHKNLQNWQSTKLWSIEWLNCTILAHWSGALHLSFILIWLLAPVLFFPLTNLQWKSSQKSVHKIWKIYLLDPFKKLLVQKYEIVLVRPHSTFSTRAQNWIFSGSQAFVGSWHWNTFIGQFFEATRACSRQMKSLES